MLWGRIKWSGLLGPSILVTDKELITDRYLKVITNNFSTYVHKNRT